MSTVVTSTVAGNGDYRKLKVRDLKRLIKERGLADGFDLWHARKRHLIDLLEGRIDRLESSPVNGRVPKAGPATIDTDTVRKAVDDELKRRGDLRPVVHIHAKDRPTVKVDQVASARDPRNFCHSLQLPNT